MATTTTFKVQGLKELQRELNKLSGEVAGKIGRAATAAGAGVIRKRARELAPVGEVPHKVGRKGAVVQPGNLKRNIIMKRLKETTLDHEYGIGWRRGGGQGKDAFYGQFVEFGTVKMAAQPFMRPALEQSKGAAVEKLKQRLKARIDKAKA